VEISWEKKRNLKKIHNLPCTSLPKKIDIETNPNAKHFKLTPVRRGQKEHRDENQQQNRQHNPLLRGHVKQLLLREKKSSMPQIEEKNLKCTCL